MPLVRPRRHDNLPVLSPRRHALPAYHPHASSASKRHASRAEATSHSMPHMRMVRSHMVGSEHGREYRMSNGEVRRGEVCVRLPRVKV